MNAMIKLLLVASLCACGGKKDEPAPTAGSAAPTVAAGSGSAAGSAAGSAGSAAAGSAAVEEPLDVPTEVDFEELSTTEITDKNVEARLKEIETELKEQ